jgi:oxysterol-binding protein-related protein 8
VANEVSSDGSTPQKQIEQILAVTPILRGQKPTEKNPIPPPHYRSGSYTSTKSPTTSAHPDHPPAPDNDLIDFGQNDGSADSHVPANLHASHAVNSNPQQQHLEQILRETSTERKAQDSLIDFHDDLKRDLTTVDGHSVSLKRHDTDTSSLDEFVDAEG